MKALLMAQLDTELRMTRTVLDVVPADLTWAPHPRSLSLGRLAMHVASIPGWMKAFTIGDGYDMGPAGPGPSEPRSLADVMQAFARAEDAGRAALAACPEPALQEAWTLRRGSVLMATMSRSEAISRFCLRHLVHHRGQLTLYLRLLDARVPALYGDSADALLAPEVTR